MHTLLKLPEHFKEYEGLALMSNYDRLVCEETALPIQGNPLFSRYSAWNFNGKVWWENDKWHCEIWQYHYHIHTISATSLSEIMTHASDMYGYD